MWWARTYRNEGTAGFITKKDKVYSSELKQEAVKAYLAGEGSQDDICEKIRNSFKVPAS